MKLAAIAIFGAGYVLGTRAGRERYDQLVAIGARIADRLEERTDGLATERARVLGPEWANGLGAERVRTGSD